MIITSEFNIHLKKIQARNTKQKTPKTKPIKK